MKHDEKFKAGILRAVEIMGSQRALADACGVKPGHIWQAINQRARLQAWLAVRIVDATSGKVSMRELLPEVVDRVEAEIAERVNLP